MTATPFFNRLQTETVLERAAFQSLPLIQAAIAGRVDRPLYLAYLEQAYHHVRHTCPLMGAALSRCGQGDARYREALIEYLDEEKGHERWILEDIAALGGDAGDVEAGDGNAATRIMVGYAYYAIDRISPYALLGMVHVLEGMSVALAEKAAGGIAQSIGASAGTEGFSYLMSHGALDQDHVGFFEDLVNGIDDTRAQAVIVDTARIMYRLFGDVFRSLETAEVRHAAA